MHINVPTKKIMGILFSLLMVTSMLAVSASTALADGNSNVGIPGLGNISNESLSKMYEDEVAWYQSQTQVIKDTDQLSNYFQALINIEGNKKNRDVDPLRNALSTYQSEIDVVRQIHSNAAAAFGDGGFDAKGNVTDRQAAGQTVLAVRAYLRDAHHRLITAAYDLQHVYIKWRHEVIGVNYP